MNDTETRGAGAGENAVETRSRSIIDWPPEKITHEEAVAELERKAQEAADYNAEANRIQTEEAKRVQELFSHPPAEE